MANIESVMTGLYRVPLDTVLSDSTHGLIPHFELVTVRIRDSDGAEGTGYTYAANSGAPAFQLNGLL